MKKTSRIAILQGSVVEVRGVVRERCRRLGGGKRKAQHGHDTRLAKRMEKDLLKCREPDAVIWLTYPDIRGPGPVKNHINSIIKKLEKRLGRKLATVAKLETQMRLSPEIALLVWGATESEVAGLDVADMWSATIKHAGETIVRIEPVRNWSELASYVSKRVVVEETGVLVGHKHSTFILSKEHKTAISGSSTLIPGSLRLPCREEHFRKVHSEWLEYTGRYHWKHRGKEIPRHRRIVAVIDEAEADRLRFEVNRWRKDHFVGPQQGFSLCGAALAHIDLSTMLAPPRVPTVLRFGDVRPSIYETEMPLDWAERHIAPGDCVGAESRPLSALTEGWLHHTGYPQQYPLQTNQGRYPAHIARRECDGPSTFASISAERVTVHMSPGRYVSFSFRSQVQTVVGQDGNYVLSHRSFFSHQASPPLAESG